MARNCQDCKHYDFCKKARPWRSHRTCKFYELPWWNFWSMKPKKAKPEPLTENETNEEEIP